MDSITQAALGAAMGELVLGKRIGNRALAWGALFGSIQDLDVLFAPFFDTAGDLWLHRTVSHSLLFMVILTFAVTPWLARLWKRDKITKARAATFVFLALATHVLIDCFTVYGTPVLWPFSPRRFAFNNLFIVDLFFTIPLLGSLIWLAFLRTKKQQPKRRRIAWWGVGLSSIYVAFSFLAKWAVSSGFDADLERRNVTYERRMEAPTPFNIMLWRSVVDRGDEFWVGYRSVFEFTQTPVRWTVYPKGTEAFAEAAATREAKAIDRFSSGWWIARTHSKGIWLGDIRFGEVRTWGARKGVVDSRLAFSWILDAGKKGDRLREVHRETPEAKEILKRMALRVIGNREKWEASPRLAGVHGSLPQPLRVIE